MDIAINDGIPTSFEGSEEEYVQLSLAKTPYTMILILFSYLYFVLKCGPAFMKNREPFVLRKSILAYNAIQIIANVTLFYLIFENLITENKNYFCIKLTRRLGPLYHSYWLLKFVDLIETVIFVLRKKQNQVSALHLYHHLSIIICTYVGYANGPGGHHSIYGLLNCAVHSVMYTYYFSVIYDPKYGKLLSWKKFVTKIQLVQFILLFIHYGWPLIFGHCSSMTKPFFLMGVLQSVIMLILFGRFYIRTYGNKKSRK